MKRILAAIVHNEAGVFKPRHQCVESSSGDIESISVGTPNSRNFRE